MFSGIIETMGTVAAVEREGENARFRIAAVFDEPLYLGQSLSHDGACLTVEKICADGREYETVAVAETLRKTRLGELRPGDAVNLERALKVGARLDGHFVLGHVDTVTTVTRIVPRDGSREIHFVLPPGAPVVPKGSIALNGVSLTIAELHDDEFSIAVIPYTWERTNLSRLTPGSRVNVEYDVLGKYILRFR
ncbi:MAG: riboflavin synthase [Bacteroidia bacterium]|nr:riboflavin synthase [Bacteroidia bacterium]MDW8334361.1 riboflavin synthase [Bacteroidia bacterium]